MARACGVSIALGEAADAITIASIVVLNGLIGFFQERRAQQAISALRSMTAPRARVRRHGSPRIVPAAEVVPGDIVVLEAGDIVPADARLLEAHALSTNESLLTGESAAAEKSPDSPRAELSLAERCDSVLMGTGVAAGSGVAEVLATGMASELGKIAHLISSAEEEATPLLYVARRDGDLHGQNWHADNRNHDGARSLRIRSESITFRRRGVQ